MFAVRGGQIHVLDELKGHPDTETLGAALKARWGGHRIIAYPDPSGRSRKTSAPVGQTDFTILESYGITCVAKGAAPPIVDSVASVNRMLLNARGQTNFFLHPRCKGSISSLEKTVWLDNPDSAVIDKSDGVEHFSDGFRYGTHALFPIKRDRVHAKRGFGF
jgi:hypothetical protein